MPFIHKFKKNSKNKVLADIFVYGDRKKKAYRLPLLEIL